MPTELEELVEFLHHGNTQIRQAAVEYLVSYSNDASIFKKPQMVPVKDLTLLIRDYTPIAKNVFTILINISHDAEVLEYLATNDGFVEELLRKITDTTDPTGTECATLLANLAKSDTLSRLISQTRAVPKSISTSTHTLDQLMDCFVKETTTTNPSANFDYLAYFFADISKHKSGRAYFTTRQPYDDVIPISKLTVFTEHPSLIRRQGVASTIKNVAFEIDFHPTLLDPDDVNILPYILLPLAGNEEFPDHEMVDMLPDLQLLPPDKSREVDRDVLVTHLETLLLLTTTKPGRERMRKSGVYPVVRECHLHVEDDGVREACDRLVQVLMREEEGEGKGEGARNEEKEDDDARVEEIF